MEPKTIQFKVWIIEKAKAKIAAAAKHDGVSMSQLIERMVDRYLPDEG